MRVIRRLWLTLLYRTATWAWWLLLAALILAGQAYADLTWWWEQHRCKPTPRD